MSMDRKDLRIDVAQDTSPLLESVRRLDDYIHPAKKIINKLQGRSQASGVALKNSLIDRELHK